MAERSLPFRGVRTRQLAACVAKRQNAVPKGAAAACPGVYFAPAGRAAPLCVCLAEWFYFIKQKRHGQAVKLKLDHYFQTYALINKDFYGRHGAAGAGGASGAALQPNRSLCVDNTTPSRYTLL
ncbi:MAG TPA: hypothetical protein H9706_03470 [Candidatus Gemmiger stercorigallinarum]|nr:hypothetical protein [Candidatus Gemmiger stercorigallinarum]